MFQTLRSVCAFGAWCVLLLYASSCAPKPVADPANAMLDRDLTVRARLGAMDQAATEAVDESVWRENLKTIMSSPGYQGEARIRAFEYLYDLDPEDARTTLLYRFPALPSFDFIAYACGRIAAENWLEFTPALIRSLSQPAGDRTYDERPDYQALAALHPERSVESVIFEFVSTVVTDPVLNRWQLTAYELLNEMNPDGEWRRALGALTHEAPAFLRSVQAAQRDLGVTPRTREEIRWLEYLRQPEQEDVWLEFVAVASSIPATRKEGLRLRHLPVLAAARVRRPDLLTLSGDRLYSMLETALESTEIYPRTSRGVLEHLADRKSQLVWADLLALHLARDLMGSVEVRAALKREWASDREDSTTEYGGLIRIVEDGWVVTPFAPTQRRHDQKFYAPDEMITAGFTAPFHFHFHVQQERNRAYAGPGVGDLQYADAMAINSLVFTSLNRHRLNVDFYTENGMVVDLGVIE